MTGLLECKDCIFATTSPAKWVEHYKNTGHYSFTEYEVEE